MGWIQATFRSSLGQKALMAVSGIMLFGFVFTHMTGNLKLYVGPEAFNHYAADLRGLGAPFFPEEGLLWLLRILLIAAVIAHIVSAFLVTRQARAARGGSRYRKHSYVQADYAVRTMRWGGVIILLFIIYHLLHLTWGVAHPDFMHPTRELVGGEVVVQYHAYQNVVSGFRNPLVSLFYIIANLALGLHLYHGLWSLFQTLGWNHPRYNSWRRGFAALFAFLVTAGNVSFPIAVMTGVVG